MLVRPLKRKKKELIAQYHLLRACRAGYNRACSTNESLETSSSPFRPETESQIAFEVGFWWRRHYPGSLWPDSYLLKSAKAGKRLVIINDVELIMDLETRQIEEVKEG